MPLECGIIFDGIPEGAISRKVGLIWGIPDREFYEAVERAKADSALRLVSQITLQALTDWRAAAFILERRFPDDYGKRTEVTGKDGGPVKVDAKTQTQHVFQPSKELWDEMLRKRAEFETLRDGDTDDDTSDGL